MSFANPAWLFALLLLPALILAYIASRARARRYAVRFPAVSTLALAAAAEPRWRRHLPGVLALAALAALVIALARPHRSVRVPIGRASIVLVTDHSGSMEATDVQPTRLGAAEHAARTFVDELPGSARVGVVTFSDAPDTVQAPTTNHGLVLHIVDSQTAVGATATGDALQVALRLLDEGASGETTHAASTQSRKPRAPSAIVLLSDGAANTGRDPVEVASEAGERRIPIYTVALGTQEATIPNPDGYGPPIPVPPDPELLARIAEASHGHAFTAQDEGQLNSIYQHLGAQLATRPSSHEITATFVIAGLLLLLAAGVSSLRFSGRLP